MPTLTATVKNSIRDAINARQPIRTKRGDLLLRFGTARTSSYRYLVKDGVATPAGLWFKEISGQPLSLETEFDENKEVQRFGRSDMIQTNEGMRTVRTWDGTRMKYNYTAIGKRFYKGKNRSSLHMYQCP